MDCKSCHERFRADKLIEDWAKANGEEIEADGWTNEQMQQFIADNNIACPECGGHMLVRKSAKGRIYYGCSNYPKCNFMTWDEPVPEKCPQCGQTLFKKKGQLYCAKEGCGFTKPIEKK